MVARLARRNRVGSDAISSPRMAIQIVTAPLPLGDLRRLAEGQFGEFVKAVVDVTRGIMAIGGELHADEEAVLLQDGARQSDLWGVNLYPDLPMPDFIEFDSMINVRPSQGNRSRGIEDVAVRQQIEDVVARLVAR
jgi:hypothetical protein